jgi:predicted nucleic acid-binding protein
VALVLADTSAWSRAGQRPELVARWRELLARGEIATCPPVRLELLFSARGARDYALLASDLDRLPNLLLSSEATGTAERTQSALARRGLHRGPRPIALLIAGIAQLNGATLLHYDRHFDAIARVTGQPAEWIAPRGSLD